MNEARWNHASCAMDDYIYVFAGCISLFTMTNTIERLLVAGPDAKTEQWGLIQLPEHLFKPRIFMACAALNRVEIVILGGMVETDQANKEISDVIIFDIRTNTVRKMNTIEHP